MRSAIPSAGTAISRSCDRGGGAVRRSVLYESGRRGFRVSRPSDSAGGRAPQECPLRQSGRAEWWAFPGWHHSAEVSRIPVLPVSCRSQQLFPTTGRTEALPSARQLRFAKELGHQSMPLSSRGSGSAHFVETRRVLFGARPPTHRLLSILLAPSSRRRPPRGFADPLRLRTPAGHLRVRLVRLADSSCGQSCLARAPARPFELQVRSSPVRLQSGDWVVVQTIGRAVDRGFNVHSV